MRSALDTGLVARTRPLGEVVDGLLDGTVDLLDHLGPDGFAWLHEGRGIVTSGVAARIPIPTGMSRTAVLARWVDELFAAVHHDDPLARPGTGALAVGGVPFDDGIPGELVVPARVVGLDAEGAWFTEVGPPTGAPKAFEPAGPAATPRRFDVRSPRSRSDWDGAVGQVLAAIESGRLDKVVLAREAVVTADADFDRRQIVDRLRTDHPSTYTFAAGPWIGASPELLVRRVGDRAVSRPMAGTAPADEAARLVASAKEATEHRLVVDAVVEALSPHAAELTVPDRPAIEQVPGMAHLVTTVEARLAEPAPSALALAAALHPTPAVAGTPRDAAVELIAEVEGVRRGCYAGPVGWVDVRGDGEWAVALRCAEVTGNQARLLAGAGIVAGSSPAAEWAETQTKFAPMLAALVRP